MVTAIPPDSTVGGGNTALNSSGKDLHILETAAYLRWNFIEDWPLLVYGNYANNLDAALAFPLAAISRARRETASPSTAHATSTSSRAASTKPCFGWKSVTTASAPPKSPAADSSRAWSAAR